MVCVAGIFSQNNICYSNHILTEQLQTELQQEMEARKKIERECTTIKGKYGTHIYANI